MAVSAFTIPHFGTTYYNSKPLPHEVTIGELIGHRIWKLTPQFELKSVALDTIWPCDAPLQGNVEEAGIFSFKSRGQEFVRSMSEYRPNMLTEIGMAIGTIRLWGQVIEHEYGYRAEFARVQSIDEVQGICIFKKKEVLQKLREIYCKPD